MTVMVISRVILTATLLATPSMWQAAEENAPGLPGPVAADHFTAMTTESPFSRSIDVSDSLILTGIAKMDERILVTLLNKETKETFVVSDEANPQGWKMTALKDNEDLEKISATIALGATQTVVVRYDDSSLKPGESRPGGGGESSVAEGRGRKGSKGGKGGRGGPPAEVMEKLEKLSDDQRSKLREILTKDGVSMRDLEPEERSKRFNEALKQVTK